MLAEVSNSVVVSTVVGAVLSGGFVTGIASLRKLKPESDQIIVSSAQNVVLISKDLMDELRQQMKEMEERFNRQTEVSAAAMAECHAERDDLLRSNRELRGRVEVLEAEVSTLRRGQSRK